MTWHSEAQQSTYQREALTHVVVVDFNLVENVELLRRRWLGVEEPIESDGARSSEGRQGLRAREAEGPSDGSPGEDGHSIFKLVSLPTSWLKSSRKQLPAVKGRQ